MTKLIWDDVGKKTIEHGLDHGVFYPVSGPGVAWNGLTAVTDKATSGTPDEYYFDGVKYATVPQIEQFSATLEAFTYPDEFASYDGAETDGNGLYFDKQFRKSFGLSYRTMRGNEIDQAVGYKVHLVYNAFAIPNDRNYTTDGGQTTPMMFGWDITTTPIQIEGRRASAHVFFDSTETDPFLLSYLEEILYGSDGGDPRLPTPDELIEIFNIGLWVVPDDTIYIVHEDQIKEGVSPIIDGTLVLEGTVILS